MGMSKQTSFTLMLLLAFSVVVPGSAGYLSVKMEAIGQAHRELLTLESRIRAERLAARIRKMERAYRDRRLQPIISSGREPCAPSLRSRDEPGPRPSGPAAVVPVPVAGGEPVVGGERPREGRLRARRHVERHVAQGQGTREQDARERRTRGPDTRPPDTGVPGTPRQDVREPEAQRLTAQGHPGSGTTAEAGPVERWPQLERRGRPYREGEAREEDASTAPDAIGAERAPEGTGASPGEDLPPGPPRTAPRAN